MKKITNPSAIITILTNLHERYFMLGLLPETQGQFQSIKVYMDTDGPLVIINPDLHVKICEEDGTCTPSTLEELTDAVTSWGCDRVEIEE
jgi:hypothetical protein